MEVLVEKAKKEAIEVYIIKGLLEIHCKHWILERNIVTFNRSIWWEIEGIISIAWKDGDFKANEGNLF